MSLSFSASLLQSSNVSKVDELVFVSIQGKEIEDKNSDRDNLIVH